MFAAWVVSWTSRRPWTCSILRDQMASPDGLSSIQKAALAVLDSRLSNSGIQNGGPLGGRRQTGKMKIGSRYEPHRLALGVITLHELLRGRFEAHETDAVEFISNHSDIPCLADPPYMAAGQQLYRHPMSEEDHRALARALKDVERWVVTYDDHPLVWDLYAHAAIVVLSRTSRSGYQRAKTFNGGRDQTCLQNLLEH